MEHVVDRAAHVVDARINRPVVDHVQKIYDQDLASVSRLADAIRERTPAGQTLDVTRVGHEIGRGVDPHSFHQKAWVIFGDHELADDARLHHTRSAVWGFGGLGSLIVALQLAGNFISTGQQALAFAGVSLGAMALSIGKYFHHNRRAEKFTGTGRHLGSGKTFADTALVLQLMRELGREDNSDRVRAAAEDYPELPAAVDELRNYFREAIYFSDRAAWLKPVARAIKAKLPESTISKLERASKQIVGDAYHITLSGAKGRQEFARGVRHSHVFNLDQIRFLQLTDAISLSEDGPIADEDKSAYLQIVGDGPIAGGGPDMAPNAYVWAENVHNMLVAADLLDDSSM